jgi:hypothetical protein
MFGKLLGKATMSKESTTKVEQFYGINEETETVFNFIRDEIVITNLGIYIIDIQGMTGSKIEYKYFPKKSIKYISLETPGKLDHDFDIKIGMDGNTKFFENIPHSAPIVIKVLKKQTEMGFELYKVIKSMLDSK